VSDAQRRAIRGLVQIGFVSAIIIMLAAFEIISWNETQTAAVMAVATPIVAFIQNWLEDQGSIPSYGKAPASVGANPVTDSPQRLEPH
jgi:hypothetical protein